MARPPGPSVRLRLTLSYAAVVVVVGVLLLAAVWLYLLRYVPDRALLVNADELGDVFPVRSILLRTFAPRAAAVLGGLVVVGLVGGWVLAGRMLAPLDRISDAARLAAQGSLSHRIDLDGRRDEFRELADAFDTMLARLEAHVGEQRRFAANASHELRTPLAITRTLLEVARDDPERDGGELDERLRTVNTRAIELTEALLLLSRADHGSFTPEPVDLSLLAEEATETLLPLAEGRGVTIHCAADPAATVGSPALLLQLATNLVHNAVVHNLPAGGTVTVATGTSPGSGSGTAPGPRRGSVGLTRSGTSPGSVVLTVENSGGPLSPAVVATLHEPFLRGSGRTRGDHGGVGLGLAIVTRIVEAHDGTLALAPRPSGGLVVTVRLPAAPPDRAGRARVPA